MNDKEQLEREVAYAAEGKSVLNNPAFKHALTLRKTQIFEQFCKTGYAQDDERKQAWLTMANMTALEGYFNELLTTGKMAEQTLKSINEQDK